jgi:hypothetical protein
MAAMRRAFSPLATLLVPVLVAGCAHPSRNDLPFLRAYDFAYRVHWHGTLRRSRVAVFSNAEDTYFILPAGGRRQARVFARVGRRLRAVTLRSSPPYLVAGCLARRWLVADGGAGYGAAAARRPPKGNLCIPDRRRQFFGRLVRPDRKTEIATMTELPRGRHRRRRTRAENRIVRAFRRALEQARRCPTGCTEPTPPRTGGSTALRILGRRCLPTSLQGRGTRIALHLPPDCRLRSAYAVREHRLLPLAPPRLIPGGARIDGAHPPLLLDFNRGLVALVGPRAGSGGATRRALSILVRRPPRTGRVWSVRHGLRRTLRAWCRRAGCRTRGRVPRFRLKGGRYTGSFPAALRALLHRLAHEGLVLSLRLDRTRRTLRVRTLWFYPRS